VAETFEFTEHRSCEIGTIGKTIKSYKVEQIFNEGVESSEEYSEDGGDGDYEDGQDRSQRSSNTGYGHEDDMESNSRNNSQSDKVEERQDSDDS